jgi:hypothetical protein
MGSTETEQGFTFNEISGSEGDTYLKDGVITMDVVSDPSAIHESTHGMQVFNNQIIGGSKGNIIILREKHYIVPRFQRTEANTHTIGECI